MLNGNVIGKVNATTTGSGSGVWSLREQFLAGVGNIWPLNRITDSLWSKTALLMKTNGVNNATNATFVDSSSNAFTVTRTGTPTQGSLSPFVPTGYWGGSFDGTGDYLSVADDAAIDLPGDFTIEFWINPESGISHRAGIIGHRTASWITGTDWIIRAEVNDGKVGFGYGASGEYYDMGALTVGQFTHYAVSRSGSTLRMFRNGVLVNTVTDSGTFSGTGPLLIGENNGNSIFFKGAMSNVRIVKGSAVYTAAFTPPTAPLTAIAGTSLLTLQDNRFKDNSTNNFTITKYGDTSVTRFSPFQATYETSYGGSGYFGGSGDYLVTPVSSQFNFDGQFTIEAWVNFSATTGRLNYIFNYLNDSESGWMLRYNATGSSLRFFTGLLTIDRSWTPDLKSWYHVAVTRDSSSAIRLFVNGQQLGASVTDYATFTQTQYGVRVGHTDTFGSIANARIVKGTAIYTAAFTPPTAPVTAVSGTSLLLNFNNAGVYDAARTHLPTLVDNTKASTTVKKYADASIAFDGGGDYVSIPDAPGLRFGTGDFTVECWWYPTNITSGYQTLFSKGYISTGDLLLQTGNGDGKPLFYLSGSVVLTSSTAATVNAWNHLAIVRNGTALAMYLNGLSVATTTNSTDINSTAVLKVSQDGSYPINGYVEDFRITRAARYTANFTPPTAALASVNPA